MSGKLKTDLVEVVKEALVVQTEETLTISFLSEVVLKVVEAFKIAILNRGVEVVKSVFEIIT